MDKKVGRGGERKGNGSKKGEGKTAENGKRGKTGKGIQKFEIMQYAQNFDKTENAEIQKTVRKRTTVFRQAFTEIPENTYKNRYLHKQSTDFPCNRRQNRTAPVPADAKYSEKHTDECI